ncbi:MAG: LCP family protein [Clostridium sp.]|nr:LCP family protein [Clostridium sp.]
MGYEEDKMRYEQRRSRGKQSGGRTRGRSVDYKVGGEPGKKEPGLDLITEHFQDSGHRREDSGYRREETGRRSDTRQTRGRAESRGSDIYRDPKKRKQEKRRKKRRIRIILLELVALVAILVFAGYTYISSQLDMMTKLPWNPDKIRNEEISMEKQEQMEGYWTIAIFGVDSRNSSVGSGNNSDVNIICNIDQGTGEIRLVSVYRDTYLNISEKNSYNKINAAYLQGGPEQAVAALNKNLDLDIDDYATFNWKAVADAINILGGIDLEITKAEFYYINAFITETVKATGIGSVQLTHAGMNHLDGVQAVAYGRLRLMDSDYARTERQRKVIALAFEKMKKADWNTLNCIIQTVFPQVSTSVDMEDLLKMGRMVTRYHLTESMGFPAERAEVKMGKKGACVIPDTLTSNVTNLHAYLFGDEEYVPTAQVQSISQKILEDAGKTKAEKPSSREETQPETVTVEASETAETGEESPGETGEEGMESEETGEGMESEESGEKGMEFEESGGEGPAGEKTGENGEKSTNESPSESEDDGENNSMEWPQETTEPETDSVGNMFLFPESGKRAGN